MYKELVLDTFEKACNSGFDSAVRSVSLLYMFKRLRHAVKRSLYTGKGNKQLL